MKKMDAGRGIDVRIVREASHAIRPVNSLLRFLFMTSSWDSDIDFVVSGTPRLAKVAVLAAMAYGLAAGANKALLEAETSGVDGLAVDTWQQAVLGYRHNCLMMTTIDINALFDGAPDAVSFQAVYSRMKNTAMRGAMIEKLFPTDSLSRILDWPAPIRSLDAFFSTYQAIDWALLGRLKHFRNLGVAHLLEKQYFKSITYDELGTLVELALSLARNLQGCCGWSIPIREDEVEEAKIRGYTTLSFPRSAQDRACQS